jgi:putative membrane protein
LLLDGPSIAWARSRPPAAAVAIQIRRFMLVFLAALPFALLPRVGALTPLATMLIAYPLLALDKIGDDIRDPFSPSNLGHLPLDAIEQSIENNPMDVPDGRGRAPSF